jgi:tetratricopeptide (TPR) repeat protein
MNNLNDIERDQKENVIVDRIETTGELLKEGKHSMLKGKYKLAEKLFLKAYDIKPILLNAVFLAGAYKKLCKDNDIEELYNKLINDTPADVEAINTEFKALRLNNKI